MQKQKFTPVKSLLSFAFTFLALCLLVINAFYLPIVHAHAQILSNKYFPSEIVNAYEIDEHLNYTNILNYVRKFSSMGSRVSGYNGNIEAANYIAQEFERIGLLPRGHEGYLQPFKVAVPIDMGSSVTILDTGESFEAYALWPNGIQTCSTPPEGITGKLIYVGSGELKNFDGKEVAESIVLMDFNSGNNWLYAARFGAKAVIFIESNSTISTECMNKFLDAPLHFPRLYVTKNVGRYLQNLIMQRHALRLPAPEVKISLKMRYKNVQSFNVIGAIEGTKNPKDVIIISAYYDSWSVVPAISVSANEAINVAVLLELAKYLKEHPPLTTVWFVALSGHWQALAGVREFVEQYYFGEDVMRDEIRPLMFLSVGPLSSDGQGVSLYYTSSFASVGSMMAGGWAATADISARFNRIRSLIFRKYLMDSSITYFLKEAANKEPSTYVQENFRGTGWWGSEQHPFLLDVEPVLQTGGIAFSFCSFLASKPWLGTPLNDFNFIDMEKLRPQIVTVTFIISCLVNDENLDLDWTGLKPGRLSYSPANPKGYITLKGNVITFNLTTGWYTNVPHAIVRVYIPSSTYPFGKIITIADANGSFVVHGLPMRMLFPAANYKMDAWLLNETDDEIIYAPDLGLYGEQRISTTFQPLQSVEEKSIVVMRCVSITFFDPLNPRFLRQSLIKDPRFSDQFILETPSGLSVLEFETSSEPLIYGYYYNQYEPVVMCFVQKGTKVSWLLKPPGEKRPIQVFVNASTRCLDGNGFLVEKPLKISFSIFRTSCDMYFLSLQRYNNLASHYVRKLSAEELLNLCEDYMKKVQFEYANYNYSHAYSDALYLYSIAYRVYNDEIMPLIDDTAASYLYISILIIVSSILLEKLIFHWSGKKKIFSSMFLIVSFITLFYFVHPALTLMNSSIMGMIGVTLFILSVITVLIISSEGERVIKRVEARILGIHRVESSKIGYAITGSSLAIENMRKRRFRTSLIFITLIVTSASLLSLTSTSPYTTVTMSARYYEASYDGILLKSEYGIPPKGPLEPYLLYAVEAVAGQICEVNPRVYLYPQTIYPRGVQMAISSDQGSSAWIRAILGLTKEETDLLLHDKVVGPGFSEYNYETCIISKNLAEVLNVTVGNYIKVFGRDLLVVGINEVEVVDKDLDEFSFTPVDPDVIDVINKGITPVSAEFEGQEANYPLAWHEVLIVPAKLALELGGYVSSISLRPKANVDLEDLKEICYRLSMAFDVSIFMGWKGKVYTLQRISSFVFMGWSFMAVPLIICSLNLAMHIIAGIKERENEIKIFSSVGISPTGVTFLFLLENITYSFLGSLLGYFLGLSLNWVLIQVGLLPKNFIFNFASFSIVITLITLQVFILATSIYPAYVAGKVITPSLERKWRLPTKPKGDEWEIPLMSRMNKEEALGFLAFLKEFYTGRGAETNIYIARDVTFSPKDMELKAVINLAPFETQTTQFFRIKALYSEKNYVFNIYLKRTGGRKDVWRGSNYYFIDANRKQLLLWRTLPQSKREEYILRYKNYI